MALEAQNNNDFIEQKPSDTLKKVEGSEITSNEVKETGQKNIFNGLPQTPPEFQKAATDIVENPDSKKDVDTLNEVNQAVKKPEFPPHLRAVYEQEKTAEQKNAEQTFNEYQQAKAEAGNTEKIPDESENTQFIDNVDGKTN